MTVKLEEQDQEPVRTIKEKCANCLKGPNLIKTVVVLLCTGVVVQQLTVCITKLIKVPITTYTHFDFNKTILYPSVTFCREPPYKFHKMKEYGLYAHPRFTSTWINFNFSIDLDEMWRDITYDPEEFFVQYGLDSEIDKVEIKSTTGFVYGRCHTLVPKAPSERASRQSGYSITLQHNAEDVATTTSTFPPGYHVFVHYTWEPFTEVEVYNGGVVDYLYIDVGETLDAKLTVDEYVMVSSEDEPCTDVERIKHGYSANKCTTQYIWELVGQKAGCSGPWMDIDLPRCQNYTAMRDLITSYIHNYNDHSPCLICPRFCRALLYNVYVTSRQKYYTWDTKQYAWTLLTKDARLQSQLYIHFNSKMVSVFEERYNYDWNIFVSDLGGSVGFLLGLSVIGLLEMLEKTWSSIIHPFIRKPKNKKDRNDSASVSSSTVTAELDNIDTELFKKCNDWNVQNDKIPI